MDRSIRILGTIIGCVATAALMTACGDQGQPPSAPKVVSQKIAVSANQSASSPTAAQQAAPIQPVPEPAPRPADVAAAPSGGAGISAIDTSAQPTLPPSEAAKGAPTESAAPAKTEEPLPQTAVEKAAAPDRSAAAAQVQTANASARGPVEAAVFAYNPEGRIDPFAPLFQQQAAVTAKPQEQASEETRQKRLAHTPLEKMDISQLKLVGIIQAATGNRALVEDSSGKGYVLTKGTYIGLNAGIVRDILRDKVVIEEEVEDLYGRVSIEEKEIKLQKPLGDI
jgi:type IV pilus assembly protein PilP